MRLKRVFLVGVGVGLLLFCYHISTAADFSLGLLDKKLQEQATSVALTWFKTLNNAEIATVLSLSDVPFAFNGSKIIDKTAELEKAYRELSESKGKNDIEPYEAKVTTTNSKIDRDCVPQHYFIVNLGLPSTGVNMPARALKVCIKPGDTYKVIGVSKY